MERERASAFALGALVIALAAIALVAVDRSRDEVPPSRPERAVRGTREVAPPAASARPKRRPRVTVAAVARQFAGDWLDYLAARRPVSSVRGADPSLLVAFAGGGERAPVGPGRRGLESVRCGPMRAGRRDCRARVRGVGARRFSVAARGRPRVIALALD